MLIFDFGATNNEKKWFFGIFEDGSEIFDFVFDKKTSIDRKVVFDGIGRGVGAVDNGKAVLDVDFGVY